MMICASVARGGDVKVNAVMATGPKDKPAKTFAADTPKVLALFKTKGVQNGDKLRGVWIADDVGDAAPANTKIDEATLTLEGDTDSGEFSLLKADQRLARGEISRGHLRERQVGHDREVHNRGRRKRRTKSQRDRPMNPSIRSRSKTLMSKGSPGCSHRKTARSISSSISAKGIDVDETVTLNWDKSTNKAGCEWYIKAVYADKSVGEPVRFNFCEEDLVIEF